MGVPLGGYLGLRRGKVVKTGQHLFPRTVGTAAAVHGAGADSRLPLMPLFAAPPDLSMRPRRHIMWCERPVFGGVPLGGKVRPLRGKVILAGAGPLPSAHGAAGAYTGAGVDRRLPLMAVVTPPPHPPLAAVGHGLGRQRAVF